MLPFYISAAIVGTCYLLVTDQPTSNIEVAFNLFVAFMALAGWGFIVATIVQAYWV